MSPHNSELIDLCSDWINQRSASYLAKENKVVWFASLTGHKSGNDWQEMTLEETVRVIKFTILSSGQLLNQNTLIQSFQELGKVYELGVISDFKVPSGVFNYSDKSTTSLNEEVISGIVRAISKLDIAGMFYSQVVEVYEALYKTLKMSYISAQKRNIYFRKHLLLQNYTLRENGERYMVSGVKSTVILKNNEEGYKIKRYSGTIYKNIITLTRAYLA